MAIHPTHAQFRENIEPVTSGLAGMGGASYQDQINADILRDEQEGRVSFYQQNENGYSGNILANSQAGDHNSQGHGSQKSEQEKRHSNFSAHMRSIQATKAVLTVGEKSFSYENIDTHFSRALKDDAQRFEALQERITVDPDNIVRNEDGEILNESEARETIMGNPDMQGPLPGYTQEQIYFTRGGTAIDLQAEIQSRQLMEEMNRKREILDKLESGELSEDDIDPDLLQDLYENGASIEMEAAEVSATMDDQPGYDTQTISVTFAQATQQLEELGIPLTPETPAPALSPLTIGR